MTEHQKCRICHIQLTTRAERRIGVHVGCVAEANERFSKVNIKRPSYGGNREPTG